MRKRRRSEGADLGLGPDVSAGRPRITPLDIQQKEFRLAFRGYNERDVDAFLDQLTDAVAALQQENENLRGGSAAPADAGVSAHAAREAEEIIERAREEAAAILQEAGARAQITGLQPLSRGDAHVLSAFLAEEREFLQALAAKIQDHAESVKSLAKAARERQAGESPEPVAPTSEPAQAPVPPEISDELTIMESAEGEIESGDRVAVTQEPAEADPAEEPPGERMGVESDEPAGPSPGQGDTASTTPATVEPAPVGAEPHADAEEGERSLRELFWGED